MEMSKEMLIGKAHEMLKTAYAPYSGFKVGAALLDGEGNVFTGCNVENASYGACCCAERTAVVKAVSEGSRNFKAIAVVGSSGKDTFPCGICRQVLAEFSPDIEVILQDDDKGISVYNIKELLPHSFTL